MIKIGRILAVCSGQRGLFVVYSGISSLVNTSHKGGKMKGLLLVCGLVLIGCTRAPSGKPAAAPPDTAGVRLYPSGSSKPVPARRMVVVETSALPSNIGLGFYVLKDTVENRTCYLSQAYGTVSLQCFPTMTPDSSKPAARP